MITVAIAGDGQLGRGVAGILESRADVSVLGPASRTGIAGVLQSGADIVIIATTTRLADVLPSIRSAVTSGSNVIVSAEESAFPVVVDAEAAAEIDGLARAHGVTVLGCGLNPGFLFDAFVLTAMGVVASPTGIDVTRVVDLSGFGPAVAARLGLGVSETAFHELVTAGHILGHAGFPQSMSIVADRIGVAIERIDTRLTPVLRDGVTAGIDQEYVAIVSGEPWFRAVFRGDVDLPAAGLSASDSIRIRSSVQPDTTVTIDPGISSQAGSRAIIAHSVDRVLAARAGWITVADVPPAHPVTVPTPSP